MPKILEFRVGKEQNICALQKKHPPTVAHAGNPVETVETLQRTEIMKTVTPYLPKLLPWYARQAGVSIGRAEVLWREAEAAAARSHTPKMPEYWRACTENFRAALRAEHERKQAATRVAPFFNSQQRMARLPLQVSEVMMRSAAQWYSRWYATAANSLLLAA